MTRPLVVLKLVYPRTYRLSMLCLISLLAGISEMDRLINMFCLISLAPECHITNVTIELARKDDQKHAIEAFHVVKIFLSNREKALRDYGCANC
uniref:Uncharacterized protein n=1 Tax=Tanacetum cinerariifolium TaxID=118510 RepID=A0A699Q0C7_TANCI|nr:hypothetical protein [Tanacetum cinerariifolium]